MSVTIFDPELVIARLQDQVSALRKVAGAADFAAVAESGVAQLPSAYVIPLSEKPAMNELISGASQQVLCGFGVILAVQNLRDMRGFQAHLSLREVRAATIAALLGYELDDDYDICNFAGGRVLQLSQQVLWWQDDFNTSIYYRSA